MNVFGLILHIVCLLYASGSVRIGLDSGFRNIACVDTRRHLNITLRGELIKWCGVVD